MVRESVLKGTKRSARRGPVDVVTTRRTSHHGRIRMIAAGTAMSLAVAVYVNALNNPFVYDDFATVLLNPSLQDPRNFRFVLVHNPFRPVVNVSYAIDQFMWGTRPFGFNLTNVLLHAAIVGLLFVFVLRAFEDARQRARGVAQPPPGFDVPAAFTGAVLLAVHPLMSSAVGYVSGRSELVCGVFFLAALLCGRAAMLSGQASSTSHRRWGSTRTRQAFLIVGTVVLGALAFLSKEVAIALPVVLVAYDWLILPGSLQGRRRRLWFIYLPMFALATIIAAFRWTTLMVVEAAPSVSPVLSLMTQSIVIWRYLALLAVPVGQSIMHGVHWVTSPADPLAWLAIGGLIAVLAVALRLRRIDPLVTFGVIWFFAALAPSSSVVALREGMAEHRVYFASAGLFLAVSAVSARLLPSLVRRRPHAVPGFIGLVMGVVAILSGLTMARNYLWRSPVRIWSEAIRHAPGMWEPHYALGDVLREAGSCEAAMAEYRRVLELRPRHRDAHINLGICLGQTGRLEEAEASFRRALEIDPGFSRAYTNLGTVAVLAGEPDRARDLFLKAIGMNRRSVLARLQLARLYEHTYREHRAAARLCAEALAIDPRAPGAAECVDRNRRMADGEEGGR